MIFVIHSQGQQEEEQVKLYKKLDELLSNNYSIVDGSIVFIDNPYDMERRCRAIFNRNKYLKGQSRFKKMKVAPREQMNNDCQTKGMVGRKREIKKEKSKEHMAKKAKNNPAELY